MTDKSSYSSYTAETCEVLDAYQLLYERNLKEAGPENDIYNPAGAFDALISGSVKTAMALTEPRVGLYKLTLTVAAALSIYISKSLKEF